MKTTTDKQLRAAADKGMREARQEFNREAKKALAAARSGSAEGSVDFSVALGSYRAWPDGTVTRLDSDGDSCETVLEGRPAMLRFKISRQLDNALRDRLRTGLYGASDEEVAERLLCEAVRR